MSEQKHPAEALLSLVTQYAKENGKSINVDSIKTSLMPLLEGKTIADLVKKNEVVSSDVLMNLVKSMNVMPMVEEALNKRVNNKQSDLEEIKEELREMREYLDYGIDPTDMW